MKTNQIYILDDEQDQVNLLAEIIRQCGIPSRSFTSAKKFFQAINHYTTNSILLLDLNMPEMDGIEVMRKLAEQNNPPKLILMSGHDSSVLHSAEKLGKAHQLDIIASFNKPIDIDELELLLLKYAQPSNDRYNSPPPSQPTTISSEELLTGIENNELVLHYQPKFDIQQDKLVSVEALVRWNHPSHGLLFPDHFIPMAEQQNLIDKLTRWVLNTAVKQEQEWCSRNINIGIAVNISAIDITSLTLPEQLSNLLKESKLDPTKITLEVTESALMGELVTSLDILTRLRLKGIGLSIDDFGTGYSSLSQLHRVPFSEMKIDRSFVSNMADDSEAKAIVKTCIILGHELNMEVVAEGVESKSDLEILKSLGCDLAQGYYFTKPLNIVSFEEKYFPSESK